MILFSLGVFLLISVVVGGGYLYRRVEELERLMIRQQQDSLVDLDDDER